MQPLHNYSSALRSVGQVMEKWGIDAFDLKCSDNEFCLQCGDPTPPHLTLMNLRYTADNLDVLERRGRAKRGALVTTTKQAGPAAILRALGRYVDDTSGRLVRICNSDASLDNGLIRLEYQNRHGQMRREDFSVASIHELSQRMDQERSQNSRHVRSA
jgi:hypothetical protein